METDRCRLLVKFKTVNAGMPAHNQHHAADDKENRMVGSLLT